MPVGRSWPLALLAASVLLGCPGAEAGGQHCTCADPPCSCDEGSGRPGDPCESHEDCLPGSICFNRSYCVGTGALRITLSFVVDSDFDLHVMTPAGHEISFRTDAADGGILDVDQCVEPCGFGNHVENVVFADDATPGSYEVWVVNYSGRDAGTFAVEVAQAAGTAHFQGSLPGEANAESQRFPFTVEDPVPAG